MGIPITELVQSIRGGTPELQGTWVHPQVAIALAQWLSPEFAVKVTKWEREDTRSYDLIKDRVTREYDLWKRGATHYY
jgi:hypothetical protein